MAGSLRRRLITSFVLFALALGGLFGGVTLIVYHRVEDRMVRTRLEQMVSAAPSQHRPTSTSYAGPPSAAPEPFRQRLAHLEPGYHEWEDGDDETHALLVADPETGARTVAIASVSESEVIRAALRTGSRRRCRGHHAPGPVVGAHPGGAHRVTDRAADRTARERQPGRRRAGTGAAQRNNRRRDRPVDPGPGARRPRVDGDRRARAKVLA